MGFLKGVMRSIQKMSSSARRLGDFAFRGSLWIVFGSFRFVVASGWLVLGSFWLVFGSFRLLVVEFLQCVSIYILLFFEFSLKSYKFQKNFLSFR